MEWLYRSGLALFLALILISGTARAESLTIVTEEMPPFNYTENGNVTGMATEVVRAVLDRAALSGEFRVLPWKRAYQTALRRPNVLIYSIGRNPEREDKFQWVGVIAPVNFYFFKLQRRGNVVVHSLAEARQYSVGAVSGDYTLSFLESNGFKKGENLDITSSFTLNIRKLFQERIDLILVDELTMASLIRREARAGRSYKMADLGRALFMEDLSTGMYMAFSRGTPQPIVSSARDALASLKADGTYRAILDQYRSGE